MNLTDINELCTERQDLVLRKFFLEDAEIIFKLIGRSRVHLSQHGEPTADKYLTLGDVQKSILNPPNPRRLRMGLWDTTCGGLVGSINLTPKTADTAEIGYWLGAPYVGKGYMVPAVNALTTEGFMYGFREIYGIVHPENIPSVRVLQRAGYLQKGTCIEDGIGKLVFSKEKCAVPLTRRVTEL